MANLFRRAPSAIAATLVLAFLASCVTFSVHPLYDDATSVFEPGLIGTWGDPTDKDNHTTFAFEKASENSYKLTLSDVDPPRVDVFEVHLVKLNGRLFFDAVHTEVIANGREIDVEYTMQSHLIGRISLDGDTFRFAPLEDDWLQKGFESGGITLAHELVDSDVVLTASTADLQNFVSAHANDGEAFRPSDPLHRVK